MSMNNTLDEGRESSTVADSSSIYPSNVEEGAASGSSTAEEADGGTIAPTDGATRSVLQAASSALGRAEEIVENGTSIALDDIPRVATADMTPDSDPFCGEGKRNAKPAAIGGIDTATPVWPTLPNGTYIDSKNTLQSHSILLAQQQRRCRSDTDAIIPLATTENTALAKSALPVDGVGKNDPYDHASGNSTSGSITNHEFYKQTHGIESDGRQDRRDAAPDISALTNPTALVSFQNAGNVNGSTAESMVVAATPSPVAIVIPAARPLEQPAMMVEASPLYEPNGHRVNVAAPLPMQAAEGEVATTGSATVVDGITTTDSSTLDGALSWRKLLRHELQRRRRCLSWCAALLVVVLIVSTTVGSVCRVPRGCVRPRVAQAAAAKAHRQQQIVDFVNRITLSDQGSITLASFVVPNSPVEVIALHWMVHRDPLQLTPHDDNAVSQFEFAQRYALATLWVQDSAYISDYAYTSRHVCEWDGIVCQSIDLGFPIGIQGVVTEINRPDRIVQSRIASDLGLLSSLVHFDMSDKGVSGSLPDNALRRWTDLTYFNIAGNALTGTISNAVGQWTDLVYFNMTENIEMMGPLPYSIVNWTRLKSFDASWTRLTGTIPDLIGQWTDLEHFDVSFNNLATVPDGIGSWSRLEYFDVAGNAFRGSLASIAALHWPNLTHFDVGYNALNGSLTDDHDAMAQWTRLTHFDVGFNALTGTLPKDGTMAQWTRLTHFDVGSNAITGTLPGDGAMAQWKGLTHFDVSSNPLTGTLPDSAMMQWKDLVYFSIENTTLTGSLSDSLVGQWTALQFFYLSNSTINGTIPESVAQWSNLVHTDFGNVLSGVIPSNMCRFPNVTVLTVNCDRVDCRCQDDVCRCS